MVKLNEIIYAEGGRTIQYRYETSGIAKKYFNTKDPFFTAYQEDVGKVPQSIAVIPFVANIIPIAWFAGFDVQVDELDHDYHRALTEIKSIFQKSYPESTFKGRLIVKNIINNQIEGDRSTMLFSGGIDAFATYLRHRKEQPVLATVHGADIELADHAQWESFRAFLEQEAFLDNNEKTYIRSNLRTFYTYRVQLLLKDIGWWGKIQHGLALIGSLAPLTFVKGITRIYIASSYTDHIDIAWGSTPEIDNSMSWAGIEVIHDGYELKRQDKVDLIADYARDHNKEFRLRVCYSELRDGFNCSRCEKCYRTILGLILAGQNPNKFGFNTDASMYENIIKMLTDGMSSKGMRYFWWELLEKSRGKIHPFIFEDKKSESDYLKRISQIIIDYKSTYEVSGAHKIWQRFMFVVRNRFTFLFKLYHRLRYNTL